MLSRTFVRDVIVRNKDIDGIRCRRYAGLDMGSKSMFEEVVSERDCTFDTIDTRMLEFGEDSDQ